MVQLFNKWVYSDKNGVTDANGIEYVISTYSKIWGDIAQIWLIHSKQIMKKYLQADK